MAGYGGEGNIVSNLVDQQTQTSELPVFDSATGPFGQLQAFAPLSRRRSLKRLPESLTLCRTGSKMRRPRRTCTLREVVTCRADSNKDSRKGAKTQSLLCPLFA